MPYYLPEWLHHFILLLNEWKFLMNGNYWCFLCFPAINIVYVLDFRHSNIYVAISCSFSCKLPSNKWCWSSSHMFIFHMCMFCPEMFIQGFPTFSSVQFSSVAQSCPTLCYRMDCRTVHHQLQEFTQTHVHQVGGAIQPSHPLSPLLLPTLLSFKFLLYILDISPLSDM